MSKKLKPLFSFVYSLYDDDGSYFMERDDYILSFYGKEENSKVVEVILEIKDLSSFLSETEREEYETLIDEFGEILCNFELVKNDYGFLTFVRREVYKSLVVKIFNFLSEGKITYAKSSNGNPLTREVFEKIWPELKEVYYSSELDDLM